ncbi:unnamed protein product [Rotaria sp. Silwood1]|nr:unnamed protein product [Rotaria sp. Silwood1]
MVTSLQPSFTISFSIVENAQHINLPESKYLDPLQEHFPLEINESIHYTKPISIVDYSWISLSTLFNIIALKH